MDVLVIGAGMAGLRSATLRAAAGDRVSVVDKGRRHGGRMATRRIDDASFDTGVLDLAASGPTFTELLGRWPEAAPLPPTGVPTDEAHRVDPASGPRWRGVPTMRSLPTGLATRSGTDVRLATTVTGLAVVDGRWHAALARTGDGDGGDVASLSADALVLTAPAPQALVLLRSSPGLASADTLARLETVVYVPSLTVLARPVDRDVEPDALIDVHAPVVEAGAPARVRIHRNDRTGASAVVALTLQADAEFSAAHLDGDRQAAAHALAREASERCGTPLEVLHVHGWRYAQVVQGIDLPALRDDTAGAPLVLAGDLFEAHGDAPAGLRPEGVERAFVSGGAAARLLDAEGP